MLFVRSPSREEHLVVVPNFFWGICQLREDVPLLSSVLCPMSHHAPPLRGVILVADGAVLHQSKTLGDFALAVALCTASLVEDVFEARVLVLGGHTARPRALGIQPRSP